MFFFLSYPLQHGEQRHDTLLKLLVYHGALSFDPQKPESSLKIPNRVVAERIARCIIQWGELAEGDIAHCLRSLGDDMNVIRLLDMYRHLLSTYTDPHFLNARENVHADMMFSMLFNCPIVQPRREYFITKVSGFC